MATQEIKSISEIKLISYASLIVAQVLEEIEPFIQPGVSTLELDSLCEKMIIEKGATPSFKGYGGFSGSICTSINEVVVHGIPNAHSILKEGDIITIDVGANYKGYHGDGAKTYGVGQISDEAQRLLDVTLEALHQGIAQVKAGAFVGDISHAIGTTLKKAGYGIPLEYTGHGIGESLHEEPAIPNDGFPGSGPRLQEGMTLCIEPIVHIGKPFTKVLRDNWTVITKDGSLSAHFEHTVLVTKSGCSILTTTQTKEVTHG
ncbi:MAG: type I methionyl aminopeptidase [Erysipelothrix sp.]|nr:type I methionyl aminopeptidase [Erysipelothrix sp.]